MSGTLSPDGNWLWNGQEWVPAPKPVSNQVVKQAQPLIEAAAVENNLNPAKLQKQVQNFDLNEDKQLSQIEVNQAAQSMINPPNVDYPPPPIPMPQPNAGMPGPSTSGIYNHKMIQPVPQNNVNKVVIASVISVVVLLIGSLTIYFWASDLADDATSSVSDRDKDGVIDSDDAFIDNPTQWNDTDGDGWGDNQSAGATQVDDFPNNPTQWNDTDGDGWGDNQAQGATQVDVFPNDSTEWNDFDGDGIGDNQDTDDDNDGVSDNADAFPFDSAETTDTDGDGTGNNADLDDDGDGTLDTEDAFPLDSTETADFDGDGVGNNADSDDDNDGVSDARTHSHMIPVNG